MNFPAGVFFLDPANMPALQNYLLRIGAIGDGDAISAVEKAGEGNMNCTVRVRTAVKSFIVKQARPWVEKYPDIPAPWDRALAEAKFYELVAGNAEVADYMPHVLTLDPEARLLCIQDFGSAEDFSSMYAGRRLKEEELHTLLSFLNALHESFYRHPQARDMANREMRKLNHHHIFVLPAELLQPDVRYAAEIKSLGDEYLVDGDCLLHGDFFPGSWLDTDYGVKVIDPEFSFFGSPEFDVGVLIAHLHLARSSDLVNDIFDMYEYPIQVARALQFAGVEIMRRLIGVAKLPVSFSDQEQRDLLALARALVVQ